MDEIFTWHTASPAGPLTIADILGNIHGPLVSTLLHFWMQTFGDSEFVLRLPMALASVALVPAVAYLARAAAGDRAFLPAAFLAAGSPFLGWYGQEMRNYAFAILFATLQIWATLRYRATGETKHLVALAATAIAGGLSNLNALLLVPVLLAALAWDPPPRRNRILPLVFVALAIGIAMLPWALHAMRQVEVERLMPGRDLLPGEAPLRGETTFTWPALLYTFYTFSVGYSLGPSLRALHEDASLAALVPHAAAILTTALVFGVLVLSGLHSLRRRAFPLFVLVASIAIPLALVTYFAVMNFKTFNPRYVSVGIPAWIVLCAAGLSALPTLARRVSSSLVALLFALSLAHHYFDPAYAKEDFRSATRDLARLVRPEDRIVAAGNFSPLEYYWRGRTPPFSLYWLGFARDARMAPEFGKLRATAGGVTWVFLSRSHDQDPGDRFERWMLAAYQPNVRVYPGVRLYRIGPREGY